MRAAFTAMREDEESNPNLVPSGKYLARYGQFFDGIGLRRPLSTIAAGLPPITRTVVDFDICDRDAQLSDRALGEYESRRAITGGGPPKPWSMRSAAVKRTVGPEWAPLVEAQQHAKHPMLCEIKDIEQEILLSEMKGTDSVAAYIGVTEEVRKRLNKWRETLREVDNWSSDCVRCILDLYRRHREVYPDKGVIIMD